MGDQPQNSIQLIEESLLKDEQRAIEELTLKKYHRQDRNVIITGIPRSGTSLLSFIINGFDNAVCLNEILYDVGSLPKAFSLIRKKLITGEAVPNKFDENGDLTTDTQNSPVILKDVVIQNVDENVLIGSKVNIPYLNQLPFLLTYGYKTICLIRDPVYTIGSWCSSKASEIPEAKVTDNDMHPRWRHFNFRTKDRIERMVQIWSHYAQLLWNYRSKLKILTYENLVLDHKREIEKLAIFLEIENPPANLNLKNGNIRSKYPEIEEIIKKVNLFCPIKNKFKYEDHDTKTSVSFRNPNSKRKIAFFAGDSDNFHFIQPIIDCLKTSEFETRIVKSNALSQEGLFNHMKWSDVSWFEWANGPIIAASRMPKECKIICRLHRYEVYSDTPKKINWESVDNLIFVSPIILDVFKEFHYKDIDKRTNVQIIPNALDLNNFKFNDRKKGFNIAYIARINSVKNPGLMVQIISELIRIDPRFKCYMVGEIQEVPQFQYICHLVKKLGLQDSIIYEGICNDVDKWLNDKHFILSTSIIESQGLSIMEGMAKGLKPVIHNFFGMPDLIFDRKYVFDTIEQAVEMFLSNDYNPQEYRGLIEQRYSLADQVENIQKIILNDTSRLSPSIPSSNMPFISIIIPTFDRAAYINEAVESALDQKYSNFEVLVLDDGSTDNTSELISSIKDSRLRYIRKSHTGAPDTRNRAIKEARGNFVIWVGSDDILLPDAIQKYVCKIHLYPEVDVFYGDLIIIDHLGASIKELKYPDFYKQNDIFLHRFLFGNVIPDGGSLIRKRLYQNFGGYNSTFKRAHDYELWARIADKINVKHIGSFVYKWRWHNSNMSSGSVQFDTSFDIQIKKDLLKSHSLQKLFPQLNWNEEKKSLEKAYFVIGNSFNQLKGYQEAIEYYKKCIEINKTESLYCTIGLTYFQAGDLQKSKLAFNEALKLNPENEKAKEISENLKKIISAKNQKQNINQGIPDLNTGWKYSHAEEIRTKISVIVPTFNRPQMLIESVKSILSQAYQNFEIIVVNDGGTDVSLIVDNFQDPRVKYIAHQKNRGLAAARNTGIRNASGQYIALLDDDDLFYPEHLETAVNALCKEYPVIYTDAVRATYGRIGDGYQLTKKTVPYSIDFDRNKLLVGNLSPVNCFVFEKNLALKAGLFDETLSTLEDWDFWIRLSSLTSFKHIAKPTVQVNWRSDGTTMTSLLGSEFKKNRQRIYEKYQAEIDQIPNVKEILNEFRKIWDQDWQVESPLTSIIILTCNQLEYTRKCLDSIFKHTQRPFELIVVDNGSRDGTVEFLESEVLAKHPDIGIKIIKNNENKGFAGGNNKGIAAASGDYILLLNNDVVVTPGWLERMITCAGKRPEIGIVGPRSNYVSGPQLVEGVDYDTHTLKGLDEFSKKFADDHTGQAQRVLRVVGFCMLIKRAVIEKIGGMDSRYGLGNFEDDDFSLRAAIADFQSWIAEDCFVHHFGHRTFIGEKVDVSKSLHKNWGVFREKWGLPADKPYGSGYRLSEMKPTRFDPSIHHYPVGNETEATGKSSNDFKSAETLYAAIQTKLSAKPSKEIIEDLQNLIISYPDFALAYNDLGVLYYSGGNKEKAQQFYEKALQLDPDNILFKKNLADFYCVELGRVEEALQIYVKILERDPRDIETLLITGHICAALQKFDDAKVFYQRVLELESQNEAAQNNLNKLDRMNPIAPEGTSPEEMYQEIQPLLNNGDPHKAIAALEKMLQSHPEFALAHNDLGVLYYHTGDKEKARQHYERAVELMPDNMNLQKNLADFLFVEQGKVAEALQIYVNILATHPDDAETLLITGHICVALKKFDDAQDFYERVLALAPDNEDAGKNLQALKNLKVGRSPAKLDSLKDMTVSSAKNEPTGLNTEESEARDTENKTTVSIVIGLDGVQNRVKECLKSIQMHTAEPHELLFVGPGATKGMLKWARQLVKDNEHCHIIECARQAGWAESINQAIQKASGEIIILTHNDVVVPEGWLKAFKTCIKLEPNIGVVGPMSNRAPGIQQLMHPDESDRVEFESIAEAFREQNQYRRVPTRKLSDFCLAFCRELPSKIGYFDEQFVSEEIVVEDFCNRAAAGGYQNLIAADTYVFHYDRHIVKKNVSMKNSAVAEEREKFKEKWNGTQNPEAKAFQTVLFLARTDEFSQKGQIDRAVEILLSAIGIQPEEKRLYLKLAEILLAGKRFQDAKDALNEMPSENGDQEIKKVLLLGYAQEGLEKYEAAQGCTEQVLAMNPNHARGLNLKGILAYRNNDRDSAGKYFKRAIASDPGYGEPYTNLAMLQLEAEQPEEALKYFEKGFILSPTDLDIATNYHAFIEGLGDFEKAEKIARQTADLYPRNQKIKYMLIDFLVQQGKYEIAMPEIEDAIVKFGIDDGILGAALKLREKLGPMTVKTSSKKATVSLCMIIKDEEKYLARCLTSVKPIVDEMIVVDTGSADRSKDIAITFGAHVHEYEWQNDFAAARNFSISRASGEWILILDGDEVISPLDYEHFNKMVAKAPRAPVAYSIITRNYNKLANIVGWVPNDGQYPDEEAAIGWLPSEKVRLFYGKDQIRFEGAVHELVDPVLKRNGIKIKKCSIPVHHYGRLDKEKLDRKGEIYFDIGQKKLSEKGEDINALRELAIQATILEKNEEAFELWQRLLALNPNSKLAAIAYVNMGTIYSRLEKFEDALDAGQKAVACDPDLKEARYNLAMAELHCGNAPNTIRILEGLLSAFPDYPPAQFILSAAYCCGGQKEKGLDGIRKLKNTPLGAHLQIPCIELGQSLLAAKKVQYAIWVLEAAIECDMVNKEILDLFNECIKMNNKAQKLSEIPAPGLTDRQVVKFQDLPQ